MHTLVDTNYTDLLDHPFAHLIDFFLFMKEIDQGIQNVYLKREM